MRAHVFRGLDALNKLVGGLIAAALGVMVLIVFWQVVVRFVLPKLGLVISAPWTEEVARYLMIWSIFLGAAVAARHGLLIAVNALVDAVPVWLGHSMKALSFVISIIFLAALTWYGYQWAQFGADESSPVLALSKIWLYLAMPVGAGLGALNILALLVDHYSKNPLWVSTQAAASID